MARAGGLLASRRLLDSVVFDLCRGPGTAAQVLCSRSCASIERSSEEQKKNPQRRSTMVGVRTLVVRCNKNAYINGAVQTPGACAVFMRSCSAPCTRGEDTIAISYINSQYHERWRGRLLHSLPNPQPGLPPAQVRGAGGGDGSTVGAAAAGSERSAGAGNTGAGAGGGGGGGAGGVSRTPSSYQLRSGGRGGARGGGGFSRTPLSYHDLTPGPRAAVAIGGSGGGGQRPALRCAPPPPPTAGIDPRRNVTRRKAELMSLRVRSSLLSRG
jgi:hypothetical protein